MDNNYNYYEQTEDATDQEVKIKKPKKKKGFVKKTAIIVSAAVLFGAVSGAVFTATAYYGNKLTGISTNKKTEVKDVPKVNSISYNAGGSIGDVSDIVDRVMPSVVSITNLGIQQVQDFFFGGIIEEKSESAGTGIIIAESDDELLIVTNNHVIAGSEELTVTFADNKSVSADIKGTDAPHDVAVIAVQLKDMDEDTKEAVTVATLGDSDAIKVGETAIAIGNALGYGQTVTTGVISAKDRTMDQPNSDMSSGQENIKLIQTDAAINHGNSGGALVNSRGEVIGINSSKLVGDSVEGFGYAIPISDVSDIIMELMNQKTKIKIDEKDRGYLGITGFDVIPDYAESFDMPVGVYVKEVIEDGAADEAGIEKGDIIVKIEGSTVNGMGSLKEQLKYYAVGEEVKITVEKPLSGDKYEEQDYVVKLKPIEE